MCRPMHMQYMYVYIGLCLYVALTIHVTMYIIYVCTHACMYVNLLVYVQMCNYVCMPMSVCFIGVDLSKTLEGNTKILGEKGDNN